MIDRPVRGEAGPQVDASELSPAPLPLQPLRPAGQEYTVQSGDTLLGIAERHGVTVEYLVRLNGLQNPDQIAAGQRLRIDAAEPAGPVLPADGVLTRVQLWPWPPQQGQTLVVWLQARAPVTFTLVFAGIQRGVVSTDGRKAAALIPIGPLAEPTTQVLQIGAGRSTFELGVPVQEGQFPKYDVPASVSQPILTEGDKVRLESERLDLLFETETPGGWTPRSRFSIPVAGDYSISDPYGSRRTYGGGGAVSAHAGEDLSAIPGTPVRAPAAADVLLAEPLFVRGNAVVLDHGNGVLTGYWHLQELAVEPGQRVEAGDLIGAVGSTGLSTGAHLHWEMRVHGMAVDPVQWVAQ